MTIVHGLRGRLRRIMAGALLLVLAAADGRAMTMTESYPIVNQIMDGGAFSFSLRFDEPVDHYASRLILVTPQGRRTLQVRLESEPTYVYAAVGRLSPGRHELRWRVRAKGGKLLTGSIPFVVQ